MQSSPTAHRAAAIPAGVRRCVALATDRRMRRAHRLFKGFPPGSYRTIVDIGAHTGEFADLARTYFQPETVWMIEADPELAERLREKYAPVPGCKVIHAAVGSVTGTTEFRINRHRASSSLLPIHPASAGLFNADLTEEGILSVPSFRLDDLFARERLGQVDLMKVDIQGAERLLVQGGARALKSVRLLYIEVLFEELYQGCALFGELHGALVESGFKLRTLDDFHRGPDGGLTYANGLYFRPAAST